MDTDVAGSFRTASQLSAAIRSGQMSAEEVVEAYLDRIESADSQLNAYVTVAAERARERAAEVDAAGERGESLGPLHGVPVAVKDLSGFVEGVRHTFGSVVFTEFVPEHSAAVVERLEDAGAIILGKTNTPEFGHKGTTTNRLVGRTANPFVHERTPFGSSGGSAAAVAADLAVLGQGSDTAGSIRLPASACNLFGIKASPGVVPTASRPDGFGDRQPFIELGPLTRTVADAALFLDAVAGPHPRDPSSVPAPATFTDALDRSIDGLSAGLSTTLDGLFPVDSRVEARVRERAGDLSAAGMSVEEAELSIDPSFEALRDSFTIGLQVGYAKRHELFKSEFGVDILEENREKVADAVIERTETGQTYSAVELAAANVPRTALFDAIQDVFETHDILVTPTAAVPPFEDTGEWPFPAEVEGQTIDPYHGWFPTWIFNMTGHPAASVPAGFTEEGLPVGVQIVGRRYADDEVLAVSAALERISPWHDAYDRTGS